MNEITTAVQPAFIQMVTAVLTALLALLSAYAVKGIKAVTLKARAQTEALANDQFRALVYEAVNRVDDLATKTVTQIEQTAAKAIREAAKADPSKKDELEALGRQAVEEIMEALGDDYKDALLESIGDVEQYVTKAVESKVYELKNGTRYLTGLIA